MKKTNAHVNSFNSVRGIAAIMVLIAHIPNINQPSLGASGVWLFFVLSGFLLFLFFEKKISKAFFLSLPNYFWRRFWRIIPMYLTTIVVYGIYYSFKDNRLAIDWIMSHLFFLKAFGHFWSIKVEVIFYLILPIVLVPFAYIGNIGFRFMMMLITTILCYYFFEYKKVFLIDASSGNLAPFFTPFFIGICCAIIREKIPPKLCKFLFYFGFGGLLLLSLDWSYLTALRKILLPIEQVDNIGWRYPYLIYPLAGIIVLGAYRTKGILENKQLIYTGQLTYGIYLWHILCITVLKDYITNEALILCFTLLASYLLSSLSYHKIEKPCIAFSKRHQLVVT